MGSRGEFYVPLGDDKPRMKKQIVTGMLTTAVLILIAAAALANLGVSIATLVKMPSNHHYEHAEVHENHSMNAVKKTYAPHKDYDPIESGEYDFVIAGGGTGGLAAMGRLGAVTLNPGDTTKILVLEAGRWLEPAMQTLSYTLTKNNGTPEQHQQSVPHNWVAAIDSWIAQYYGNQLSDGSLPSYGFGIMNPYKYNDGKTVIRTSDNKTLLEVLRGLRDTFLDNPASSPYKLVTDIPSMTFNLGTVNVAGSLTMNKITNLEQLTAENDGTWSFTGNPVALMDPVFSDFRATGFMQTLGNTEDLFFYDTIYSNGKDSYKQNYPRGKALGGSTVSNAQIHYGFTDRVLADLAEAVKDPNWASPHVESMVRGCNTVSNNCDFRNAEANAQNCLGPVFGVPLVGLSDPSFVKPDTQKWLKETVGIPNAPYVPGVGDVFDNIYAQTTFNPNYMTAEFEQSKRDLSYLTSISVNPFTKRHSGSHDVIANLIGLGAGVCFFPSESHRILSPYVIPANLNCAAPGNTARIHIRTGTLVTGLTFDETGPVPRVTGVQWVNEFDQDRPDQNRMEINSGRECTPGSSIAGDKYGGSLYGNGLPNTADCKNAYTTLELMAGASLAHGAELAGRNWASDGEVNYYGLKGAGSGRATHFQRKSSPGKNLPALKLVKSVSVKKEVILSLGAAATSATLIRSGISSKGESERLGTKLRSEVETGYMTDNYETLISLAPKNISPSPTYFVSKIAPMVFDLFDGDNLQSVGISRSFLREDTWEINKPWSTAQLWYNLRLKIRTDAETGYHKNLHYIKNLFPTFTAPIYSARGNTFAYNTVFIWDLFQPGQTLGDALAGGLKNFGPVTGPLALVEVTGKNDIRFKANRLELPSTHPLEKLTWHVTNAHNPDRCKAFKNEFNEFRNAAKATYPEMDFEIMQYTDRKLPFESFLTNGFTNGIWTGDVFTNIAQYEAYFNDATNPIISGLDFGDDDRSFCEKLNMKQSGHHIMGGAMMGAADDEMAVTDSRGRVYGIKGLRVSDSSLMPIATSGNPWVTIFQLGNVIGNFVAEDWGYDTTNINKNSNPITNVNHPYYHSNLQIGTPYYPVHS